jgi:hypothetical protein
MRATASRKAFLFHLFYPEKNTCGKNRKSSETARAAKFYVTKPRWYWGRRIIQKGEEKNE